MRGYPKTMFCRPCRYGAIFFTVVFLLSTTCSNKPDDKTQSIGQTGFFLDDSLSLQAASTRIASRLCSVFHATDTASLASFNRMLDSAAAAVRTGLPAKNNGRAALDSIKNIVYSKWEIGFDSCDTSLETLLPHRVFRTRKGACLGVSLIMLMLAEKLGCPLYGVVLPGHFFCRYDDGGRRINVEPNRHGCLHDDGYYRQRYLVAQMPWYTLDNLSSSATIGVFCYNAGTLCLNTKKYSDAIEFLNEAARRLPEFPEVRGNLALSYAQEKQYDSAFSLFEKVFVVHPDLKNLALNYGSVLVAERQYRKASDVFTKGLKYFPNDSALINGLLKCNNK
jgi:tetratricopeptide (TPR) repeat protein